MIRKKASIELQRSLSDVNVIEKKKMKKKGSRRKRAAIEGLSRSQRLLDRFSPKSIERDEMSPAAGAVRATTTSETAAAMQMKKKLKKKK